MKSFILVTDNSENYIHDVLCSLLPLQDGEELIIFDNHSKDNTVPIIISTIGIMIKDNDKYKFYINKKIEDYDIVKNKAISIANGTPIIIDNKEKFEINEVLKCYE